MKRHPVIPLFLAGWLLASPAFAGPFDDGIASFNGGQYAAALSSFQQQLQVNPQDPLTHYYVGLSLHCLGRVPEAAREYNWVLANTQDEELLKRVRLGLQNMGSGQAAYRGMSQTAYQPQQAAYQQQTAYGQTNGAAVQPGGPPPKIVDLYTNWCGWCKKFAPIFHEAEAKYAGRITFQSLDAEARANSRLVKKYRVRGYPTILFFDGSGKLVKRIDGAPQSMQDFETEMSQAYPGLVNQ